MFKVRSEKVSLYSKKFGTLNHKSKDVEKEVKEIIDNAK